MRFNFLFISYVPQPAFISSLLLLSQDLYCFKVSMVCSGSQCNSICLILPGCLTTAAAWVSKSLLAMVISIQCYGFVHSPGYKNLITSGWKNSSRYLNLAVAVFFKHFAHFWFSLNWWILLSLFSFLSLSDRFFLIGVAATRIFHKLLQCRPTAAVSHYVDNWI